MSTLARLWRLARFSLRGREVARARVLWNEQEPELRLQFAEIARDRAAARGVRWSPLEWGNDVVFARDRETGLLTAMAGFVIRFEMEDLLDDNENATLPRDATAIFHFQRGMRNQRGVWGTGGKTLFNMSPGLALARLADQFEPVVD